MSGLADGRRYWASDGSTWWVECDCPPIPWRGADWSACPEHDEERETIYAATRAGLVKKIEERVKEGEE